MSVCAGVCIPHVFPSVNVNTSLYRSVCSVVNVVLLMFMYVRDSLQASHSFIPLQVMKFVSSWKPPTLWNAALLRGRLRCLPDFITISGISGAEIVLISPETPMQSTEHSAAGKCGFHLYEMPSRLSVTDSQQGRVS